VFGGSGGVWFPVAVERLDERQPLAQLQGKVRVQDVGAFGMNF